jgi:hypothetical protein
LDSSETFKKKRNATSFTYEAMGILVKPYPGPFYLDYRIGKP